MDVDGATVAAYECDMDRKSNRGKSWATGGQELRKSWGWVLAWYIVHRHPTRSLSHVCVSRAFCHNETNFEVFVVPIPVPASPDCCLLPCRLPACHSSRTRRSPLDDDHFTSRSRLCTTNGIPLQHAASFNFNNLPPEHSDAGAENQKHGTQCSSLSRNPDEGRHGPSSSSQSPSSSSTSIHPSPSRLSPPQKLLTL